MNKNFTVKRKLWKVMKICAAQGMIAFLICGMAIAHDDHAQLLEKKIVVSVKDVSLKDALKEISVAGDVKFSYRNDQYKYELSQRVSVESDGRSLGDVLNLLLAPYYIKYKVIEERQSIVFEQREDNEAYDSAMDLKTDVKLVAVTGKVTDAVTQQPMAGVNVIIKGTAKGTTTDVSGVFSLEANEEEIIVFSFIGYTSFETKVGNRNIIEVALQEDVKNLEEVVINVGYWEVKEKERTGNISRVSAEEIQKQPVNNPLQALQGRMPGVYIQQDTGVPGGGFRIQVRGQNSLRNGQGGTVNGNLPLYLIDGVPFTSTSLTSSATTSGNLQGGNPLSTLNPSDIQSIEVLKDADATAIYGSRGANGVVLITTKKAKAGKSSLDVNVYQGIGQVSHFVDLLNTKQYITMRKEAFKNDATVPTIVRAPDLLLWDTTRQTNWQKELIGGTANITNAQLSFSGGNAATQFIFGGGYYRETTVFPGTNSFQRASGRLGVNHESTDKRLKFSGSVAYTLSKSNIPTVDFTQQSTSLSPNAPSLYDENGNLNWANDTWINPLSFLERKYENSIENFVSNASFSYEIISGLHLKATGGYTSMNVDERTANPLSAFSPQSQIGRTGSATFGASNIKTWIVEPQIDYSRTISKGVLSALIGTTFQESIQSGRTLEGNGFTSDAFLDNIRAATTLTVSENNYSQYKYTAVFARVNYNWDGKYILNLTSRRDGSSRFGPGNRFANFGAVGAAWIFSSEPFVINHLPFLSFGKLRSSFGATGSDAIGNYQFLETYSPTTNPYAGSSGLTLTRLSNPDYSWETNTKFESGLELGFFKDRLMLTVSYYLNNSTGQLVGFPLPVITGQSSVQYNFPATVQNDGWEFQISTVNFKSETFQWTSNFNITLPTNRLSDFPDIEKFPAYAVKYDVGKSVYTYKSYQFDRVDPQSGLYTFADLNSDGVLSNPADLVGRREITQTFYGGLGNTFKIRNFQLDFFFQFVKQKGYDYFRSFAVPGTLNNQLSVVMNRWTMPGSNDNVQRFTAIDPTAQVSAAYNNNIFSDNGIADASFVRLKNVSISWQLPSKWMQKIKLDGSRIYIQGQNLLTFTDYLGLDPENQSSQTLPPLRIITAGINISI